MTEHQSSPSHPAPSQPSPWTHRPVTWAVAALLIGVSLGGGSLWWTRANSLPVVVTETARLGPVTRVLAVNGKIAAQDQVQIKPTVGGTVLEVMAREGDVVAKGAVLAQIDPGQQQAIVAAARAAVMQGQTRQTQAAASHARARDLGPVMPRATLDEAFNTLQAAQQEVARLQAVLDQAVIQLSRFQVLAPISGTVIARSVDLGQLADTQTPMFTLADLSVLTVDTTVDEAYAADIALGQSALLQLVGSREILAGKVRFAAPRIDTTTGGRAVTIGFDAPLSAPVGMTVTANIIVDQRQALTVPRAALQGDAVFRKIGRVARLTPVSVIEWPAARLIVTQGLTAGDQVIIDAAGLVDGQGVR